MADFSSLKSLENYLQGKIKGAMNDVGRMGEQLVKDTMDEVVYAHEPAEYQRTFELRDSITWYRHDDLKDGVTIEIYSDEHTIHSYEDGFRHYSAYYVEGESEYPQDYSAWVAGTVEYGTSGGFFGQGFWTEPRPFMKRSREAMRNYSLASKTLKYGLKRSGLNVE
jgi:hypothetical protein